MPTASHARPGSAGSSSPTQCRPANATKASSTLPRANHERQQRAARGGLAQPPGGRAGGAASVLTRRLPTAAITAALPVRPATKPWQPATSSTARRPAIAPGTTIRQPPGVRPSPRGGRSITRAATKTTSPRRFWAAVSAGPAASSISASRTCACGQASRSGSIVTARRSPGSSSPQPVLRAKWTVSEAAARTLASSASCEAGRARVEHDERPRVGLGDQLALHQPGAARDGRPVDARRGRALAVLAQAVDLGLGRGDQRGARVRARRPSPPPAVARTGSTRGSTSTSSACAPVEHALGEPERVAQHERRRRQHAPAAAPERHLDAHARARAPGGEPHRLGQQRLVDPARAAAAAGRAWPRSGPAAAPPRRRCARRSCGAIARPSAPSPIHAAAPAPSSTARRR